MDIIHVVDFLSTIKCKLDKWNKIVRVIGCFGLGGVDYKSKIGPRKFYLELADARRSGVTVKKYSSKKSTPGVLFF